MEEKLENIGEELVSACEPSMPSVRFKQVPYNAMVKLQKPGIMYAGVWPVGEWRIKPTYLPVKELDAKNGIK